MITTHNTRTGGEADIPLLRDLRLHVQDMGMTVVGTDIVAAIDVIEYLDARSRHMETERDHFYALAVDDPGKNPPQFWKDTVEALQAENASLLSQVERLKEALKPFAAIASEYTDEEDDDFQVWKDFDVLGATLPLKIFRRALAALQEKSHD